MKRTFIGLEIKKDPALTDLIQYLKKEFRDENIHWIEPDNLHLTLRFLGNTEDYQITGIIKELEYILKRTDPFYINIQGLGIFGKLDFPKIMWMGIDLPHNISIFLNMIEDVLTNFGFEKEMRPFSPHLTIGRIKFLKNHSKLKNILDLHRTIIFSKQEVRQIVFYESLLKSSGSIYNPIHIFSLSNS